MGILWNIFVIAIVLMGWIWMWGLGDFLTSIVYIAISLCSFGIVPIFTVIIIYFLITGK